jgi:hypothetical protein
MKNARAIHAEGAPGFYLPEKIMNAFSAALDEIERLQRIVSEPVESFGTPELVAWVGGLQKILLDFPEEERGQIPFVIMMGCHLEKFAKSWNSPAIASQAKRIAELEADIEQLTALVAAKDVDVVFVERRL